MNYAFLICLLAVKRVVTGHFEEEDDAGFLFCITQVLNSWPLPSKAHHDLIFIIHIQTTLVTARRTNHLQCPYSISSRPTQTILSSNLLNDSSLKSCVSSPVFLSPVLHISLLQHTWFKLLIRTDGRKPLLSESMYKLSQMSKNQEAIMALWNERSFLFTSTGVCEP